jgi:hypothetical protein
MGFWYLNTVRKIYSLPVRVRIGWLFPKYLYLKDILESSRNKELGIRMEVVNTIDSTTMWQLIQGFF